ncbi:beta-ketoacyl-[acyl-carrier-protein] synthase family protein [Shewanella sp. Scap07]|uniref:beta-ketoacyl-[acyl-carrier-protein] synthase family protein n=1 Tax=Shewanella sp. Scap07 TaxID=2589987 RepID=UPI0015BB1F90|nr:beta-ketoacyl-[acyl-carrier-protein] synthase family protein [Shewanella sp. Scap07]QLE87294.1 beta-ketoacyl-[acyl-carrier-protein] synthase family protein [Shewanella sp. Scap07]
MTDIAISSLGLCTPLGQTPQAVLDNLINGDTQGMVWRDDLIPNKSVLVGEVSGSLPTLPAEFNQYDCRNNQLLLSAMLQIAPQVDAAKQQYGADRVAVVIGTSTSGINRGEQALAYLDQHDSLPTDYRYQKQELGNSSEFVSHYFALSGPCYTVSTACSSSAKVFASARGLLLAGLCDMVIVGGADSLCKLTLNGFDSLESIASGHCLPFNEQRDGINIGEGAALFTVTLGQAAVQLLAVGESSDAHHISAPHPDGRGAIAAMTDALQQANLSAQDIDYVNLHGTATPKNDAMESRAIAAVFADNLPPCSSTKPLTGHTLGAAGAIEAAFAYLLLSDFNGQQRLPPQVGDGSQDSSNPQLTMVTTAPAARLRYVMSNSFAFGGSNASVIFARGTQ